MIDVRKNYTWEAVDADGNVVTKGPGDNGSLSGFVRFSLIPAPGLALPRHDIVGVKMIRRFCRAFIKTHFNSKEDLPGLIFWEDGVQRQKTSKDLTDYLKPGDFVGKGVAGDNWFMVREVQPVFIQLVDPYHGISKPQGLKGRKVSRELGERGFQYLHCIVLEHSRVWINYATGAVTVTEKDREVRL